MMSRGGGAHRRPARVFVLIFISSSSLSDWVHVIHERLRRYAANRDYTKMSLGGEQVRPARTLVLIFMVSAPQIPGSMMMGPGPPQLRPARTFVLIFM
jgi:hypothetical protein